MKPKVLSYLSFFAWSNLGCHGLRNGSGGRNFFVLCTPFPYKIKKYGRPNLKKAWWKTTTQLFLLSHFPTSIRLANQEALPCPYLLSIVNSSLTLFFLPSAERSTWKIQPPTQSAHWVEYLLRSGRASTGYPNMWTPVNVLMSCQRGRRL